CVCGLRRQDRESPASLLLLDLPEHASQSAPGIRDGAPTLAAIAGTNADYLRLAFPSGRVRAKRFQSARRDRVLGHDQQARLARVRTEPARNFIARVCTGTLLVARIHPGRVGRVLSAPDGN